MRTVRGGHEGHLQWKRHMHWVRRGGGKLSGGVCSCHKAVNPLSMHPFLPPSLSQTALAVISRVQHGALLRSLHSWRCFMALRMRRHMADRHAAVT